MKESKSIDPWAFYIAPVIVIFLGWLSWDIPVDVTEAGNRVTVGDYVTVALPFLKTPSTVNTPPAHAVLPPTPKKGLIDAEVFGLFKPGVTTYSLLRQYLGAGELQSASVFDDVRTETYVWRNPDGSAAILTFQNGVMMSKTQVGLN